jgi:hypothetical protein
MTEIIGKCPDCFMNGAPVEALHRLKKLVDGVRCGPCRRIAIREGRLPKPPKPPKPIKPKSPRPKSEGYMKRRAEEDSLRQVLAGLYKGTHFLRDAARALGWSLEQTQHVYGRLYDRGHRRRPAKTGSVAALLEKSPRSFEELKSLTGLTDGGVYAALKALGDRLTVARDEFDKRKRVYKLHKPEPENFPEDPYDCSV